MQHSHLSRQSQDLPSEEAVMQQLEQEQLQIGRIQQQAGMIARVQHNIQRKDKEILKLRQLVEKYQPSYQQTTELRLQLAEKQSNCRTFSRQFTILRKEFEELVDQCRQLTLKLQKVEGEKEVLVRQRHHLERFSREIEETFKEYQFQCRNREEELTSQLATVRQTLSATRAAPSAQTAEEIGRLREEVARLCGQLSQKEGELQKIRRINGEMSLQFDKAVNKIVEFERQLNRYRKDNHELKKTLGLVVEQEKYQKLHEKYLEDRRAPVEGDEQQEEQDSSLGSQPEQSSCPSLSGARY